MKIKTTKLLLKILILSSASFFYGAVNSQTRSPWEMDNRGFQSGLDSVFGPRERADSIFLRTQGRRTFKGYVCLDDCSGHIAGYRWAERKGIDDEDDCAGNSRSFTEGCLAYVKGD